jgi:hypothetical protein
MLRRSHRPDKDVEKRLLTGIIISDKVAAHLLPYSQPDVFELEVSKNIIRWIIEYYDKYKCAPKKHIQDLYESEKGKLKQGLDEEVGLFLAKLSEEYLTEGGPDGVNEDFIIDRGKKYLKERHLRRVGEGITSLLDIGKGEEAEKFYVNSRKIVEAVDYRWSKPMDDPQFLNRVFEEKEVPLFRMKGHLGDLLGDFQRGWLIALMGPMKRGKTWALQDFALDAMISRKRVAMMSFEMKDKHQAVRIYKQLGVMGDEGKEYIFPCFDCLNNQDNSCNMSSRTNHVAAPSKFDPKTPGDYQPCTACRKIQGGGNFLATTWFFVADRPKLTLPNTRKEIKKFKKMFGKNLLRMISFPAYSATMADVEESLDELERVEGFIPDVIITDYASIIRPEHRYNDPRHDVDDIFKAHKRLAQSRSALVITGAQSLGTGRAALSKDMQDETDIGVNAYILAHVDIMMTLDQTPDEKEKGIWRMGVVEHRWKHFNKRRQVMALQQLELGLPIMDTEIIYYRGGNKKDG